jgi:hypothetical protein
MEGTPACTIISYEEPVFEVEKFFMTGKKSKVKKNANFAIVTAHNYY